MKSKDMNFQQPSEMRRERIARISFVCLVLAFVGILLLVLALSASAQTNDACGTERVSIKQLKDPQGSKIASSPQKLTTVAAMLKLPLHTKGELLKDSNIRLVPTETTVYEIKAVLIGFKKETDQDIHIVIADPETPKHTMIVEIPAGACMASDNKTRFDSLQDQFQSEFGKATSSFKKLDSPQPFDVTGVGFFDFVHGQTGHAANGIELHPVIEFKTEEN